MIVSADRANVGTAKASVGTTIFNGDQLRTAALGSLEVRSAAARFMLTASSHATWGVQGSIPEATLTGGTAVFSTANAKAFILHAGTAEFRPQTDEPTIGNVTLLNPKELVVRCSRGALTIAVEDDVRVIPEGSAYHVLLDPDALPPADVPQWGDQKQPRKPGKSKFIWYAIAFTAVITGIAAYIAWESCDRP